MAIAIVLLVIVIAYTVKAFNILIRLAEEERAAKLGVPVKHQLSWWDSLWQRINKLSPIENEKDIDTGHDFDGIRELDNHLPPWWKWLFYATIVWSAIYLVVYHVTDTLPLSGTEYQNELAEAEREARALRASRPAEIIDLEALTYVRDEAIIARGKAIFASNNCGSCHRGDGGGNAIGPNLTDEYWLHGGSIKNIYQTIDKGFVEKGMPAWGKVMSAKDVHDVAFFVMSLKGSNPVDGRAPQGDLFKEEPKQALSDTTRVQAMNN
jgi:cytochrome c oxidase cbb3-type subunit 3